MFKLSTQKPINYTIKIGLLFIILHYIYNRILFLPLPDLIYNDSIGQVDLILIPLLLIIFMFIHFKISNKELKFMDYLKVGWFFSTLMFVYSVVFYDFNIGMAFPLSGNLDFDDLYYEAPYVIFLCLGILSSLLSVFFPKGTIKEKLGNLVKVVLFVIIIYKLIKPFIGGSDDDDDDDNDDDVVGFDTDGDGKIDTTFVDTDGDGIAETIAQDTDGDGIIDTVSSDTDGDGLIDTVVADTDGDGLADTIIKDVDIDGDGQSDYRITKRKGKGLT